MKKELFFLTSFMFPFINLFSADALSLDSRYALEVEDPYHRPVNILKPAFLLWENDWKEICPSFWDFLEQQQPLLQEQYPALYDAAYHIAWLGDNERAEYKAYFVQDEDDRIYVSTLKEGVLPDGKWMYVQMGDRYFVGMEKKYQFHHVSLSGGQPVNAAGTISIKGGKLNGLSAISGHYRPKIEHGQQFINAISSQFNLDLNDLKMTYYVVVNGEQSKAKINVHEFLKLDPNEQGEPKSVKFIVPFEKFPDLKGERFKMFLTDKEEIFVGSPKIDMGHPLCTEAGNFVLQTTVKMYQGKIDKILFKTPMDNPVEMKKLKSLIQALKDYGVDIDSVDCRLIQNNEKVVVPATQLI